MATKRRCKFDIHQLEILCTQYENISKESLTVTLLEVKQNELERRYAKMLESYEEYAMTETSQEDVKDDLGVR